MKIVICGYIGGGNCGDEAICDRLTAAIRARGDTVTLLSLAPEESRALHGVPALPRLSIAAIRAIGECDLFLLGGGTLLQTQSSRRSAIYYLGLAALVQIRGKPWVLLGGIDPLSGSVRTLAEKILPTARAFYLRDQCSLERASAIAPNVPRFFLPDSALLPLSGKSLLKSPSSRKKSPRPYIVICPKAGVREQSIASLVRSARKRGIRTVFLALSREDEAISAAFAEQFGGVWICTLPPTPSERGIPTHRKVEARVILPALAEGFSHRYFAARPCEEACRIIEGAEEVYSARLHGLIFAKKTGTPAHILPDGTKQWKFQGELAWFDQGPCPWNPLKGTF